MLDQWRPSRREMAAEVLGTAAISGWTGMWAWLADVEVWVLTLAILGAVLMCLVIILVITLLRGPRGYDKQSDRDLIHETVDHWMQRLKFGRWESSQKPNYSESLLITHSLNNTLLIGKIQDQPLLHVWSSLTWQPGTYNLNDLGWSNLKHDIALEMARFGIFSSTSENPYQIVFWV
jgi:hypothetical protein